MAEFAALPLFTDSLLADTSHLNDEEFGRYVRLLIITWRSPECKIPNDKSWIAKRLRLEPLQYESLIAPILKEFFTTDGNWHMQKRLLKEFLYTREKRQKQTDAAKSRWQKEKASSKRISKRNAPSPSPSPQYNNKPGIENLSVDDIKTWLEGKHTSGKYLTIDEHRLLEMFKDYCRSKNPKYKDYVAAFRNAFEWQNAPRKGQHHEGHRNDQPRAGKSDRAKAAIRSGLDSIPDPAAAHEGRPAGQGTGG